MAENKLTLILLFSAKVYQRLTCFLLTGQGNISIFTVKTLLYSLLHLLIARFMKFFKNVFKYVSFDLLLEICFLGPNKNGLRK
jgi:hypothetical protein